VRGIGCESKHMDGQARLDRIQVAQVAVEIEVAGFGVEEVFYCHRCWTAVRPW